MTQALSILIAGGGIGGLTAAIALARNGAKVQLFEQAAEFTEIGAGLQLSPNAMNVLKALGMEHIICAAGFEPEFAALRYYKTGQTHLKTPLKALCRARYGQPYIHIHRADLHHILINHAKETGVKFHMNCRLEAYEQEDKRVRIKTNKGAFSGQALIGADGIKSAVNAQINSDISPHFTGQIAWRGTVKADKIPNGLIEPAANIWMGPSKHFVAYYLRSGKLLNFVAVEERGQWTEESWSLKGKKSGLQSAFAGWDNAVTQLIDACDTPFMWGLFDRPELPTWQDGRAVLLGDAAHPMLPFMAQGAAMAIEDGWVLAQSLLTAHNIKDALTRYETARKPRTTMLQNISRGNAKLFHETRLSARAWRQAKLSLANKLPALQHTQLDRIYKTNVTAQFPLPSSC